MEHPDKMANDQGTVQQSVAVCVSNQLYLVKMSIITLYSCFHLGHLPDGGADTGMINLINEVLLGYGCGSDREDVNFLERKLFCLYSEGPIKMSSFFVWNKFLVSVCTSE